MISAGKKGQSPAGTVPASRATAPTRKGLSPQGTVPTPRQPVPIRKSQRGYLLVTVIITLFLLASIAVLLSNDSAMSANTSNKELESARVEYVAAAGLQAALWRAQNNACMGDVTIPDTVLGNDKYSATITGAAAGTLYQLAADQDAWIRNDDVTKNNGTAAEQHIRFEGGNIEHALTRFDLSSLPEGAQINSAVAWFYVSTGGTGGGIHPEGPLTVHNVTADWTENMATWENMGGSYESSVLASIPPQEQSGVWVSINLTGQVQAWVNGQPNFGILFASSAEGVHGEYASREDGSNPPRLEVVVGSGPSSPVVVTAMGELDNGVSRTLKDKQAIAYQPPVRTVLQPGLEGKDAAVRSANPNDNFGTAIEIRVTGGADPEHALIQFPVEKIPAGSRIASARMEVYLTYMGSSDPAGEFSVHPMNEAWTEGTGDSWNPGDGANWNTADGSQAWDWQSNHDAAIAVDTTVVDPSYSGWHSWDITTLAQQWSSGDRENFGVVIKGNANVANAWFRSSDYSDASQHPRLIVEYACECGSPCMAPQGSGNILMVVISPTTLVEDDQQAKDLFESWGYTVSVISESANQSSYDSAVAANDVVFISETVNSNSVGTRLVNAKIGVVSQDGDYNADLGFATGSTLKVGADIDVSSNDHYITRPFPVGPLPIYAAGMEQLVTTGALTAGQKTLAEIGGDASLVAVDQGDALEGGGNAAGRRLVLPLGTRNGFDWDYLTNEGRLIVQRSLDWGMNADITPAGNLLLVVVNPGSLTSQEQAKKTLIEGWGYTVSLVDESDSQGVYDTALAANDVVFVTEDVSSGNVGSKLNNASIGVVIEETNLADDLGFSGGIDWDSGTDFDIDNTHYITSPLTSGNVILLSSFESLAFLTGATAPDLDVLGIHDGNISIAALEGGAALSAGGTAPGRRVLLPWGGDNMDVNFLNPDGLTVFQRALEWGAGACLNQKSLLLVVGDAANPSSKDSGWQSQLGEWCYQVTLIDDGESQVDLETAAAASDVVYVSGTSSAAILTDKLADVGTPLVNEPRWLLNEFGFSEDEGYNTTYSGFLVSDASHYISAPFGGGAITIFTESRLMGTLHGTMSGDLMDLGGFATIPALAALEIGGLRWDGSPAPARRLQVPFENAEIGQLTPDGLAMLRRSVDWAAGADHYQGPVAHWKLDETSGTTAVDTVGGHDGTLINGPTWETGRMDGALDFDGSNDFVNVPHEDSLSLTDTMTFTAWINASSFGASYQTILAKDGGGAGSNYWFGTWQQLPVFGFFSGGLFREVFNPSFELQPDTWHHLAASFDNATGDTNIYVDGTLIQNGQLSQDPTAVTADLSIGRSPDGERWRGKLDDVRIYDTVLDADDIAELAAPPAVGPIAHWKLDDGTGVTAVDSIGGHDGTLINGPAWVAGQIGDALDFDGSNDLVSVPHQAVFTQVPMTVSAWFKLNTLPTTRSEHGTIIDKRHTVDPYASWTLYVNETLGNKIRFQIRDSSETGYWLDSAASAVTNTWYHVVGTIDESYNAKLYVNGALEPDDDNIGSLFSSNDEIRIGAGWSGGNRLDGVVDDVRFYDRALGAAEISGLYTDGGGGGGGGGSGGVVFEEFTEAKLSSDAKTLDVSKPGGTVAGDLLIAAMVTDGEQKPVMSITGGWTLIDHGRTSKQVTMDVWWKIAGSSEPASYNVSWAKDQEAYGWIMRFTGHDATDPINASSSAGGSSNNPTSPAVTTTVPNTMIVRIGGFDDDDISTDATGLSGHTNITMDKSNTGTGTASGGAGYVQQLTSGSSGTANFALTNSEEYRAVTIAIAPQ